MEITENHYPDQDRISVLVALILLSYSVSPLISVRVSQVTINLFGAGFLVNLNFSGLVSIFVALLAAAGMEWLLRDKEFPSKRVTWPHWIFPALTAWALGVPLNSIEIGVQWWVIFTFGGLLLIFVFYAEYMAFHLTDARHVPATIALTGVSFALFLILAITLRASGSRIYLLYPVLVLSTALVSLRTLYLQLGGLWAIEWGIGIALVIGQLAIGMHYLPLSPLEYGLLLIGPAYSLTSIAASKLEGKAWNKILFEPIIMTILFSIVAIVVE